MKVFSCVCGAQNTEVYNFCPYCGLKVEKKQLEKTLERRCEKCITVARIKKEVEVYKKEIARIKSDDEKCPECNGDGIYGFGTMVESTCIKCNGSGKKS